MAVKLGRAARLYTKRIVSHVQDRAINWDWIDAIRLRLFCRSPPQNEELSQGESVPFAMSAILKERRFDLRPMCEEDVGAVAEVERAAYPHPWTPGIFRDCLRAGYCCWVVVEGTQTVGHGVLSVAAGECHLLNVCVHPDYQRRGLGRSMVQHLLGVSRGHGAEKAFLEVRVSNRPAIALYVSEGFKSIGIRRGYYPNGAGREDALVMARDLQEFQKREGR